MDLPQGFSRRLGSSTGLMAPTHTFSNSTSPLVTLLDSSCTLLEPECIHVVSSGGLLLMTRWVRSELTSPEKSGSLCLALCVWLIFISLEGTASDDPHPCTFFCRQEVHRLLESNGFLSHSLRPVSDHRLSLPACARPFRST